MNKLGWKKMKIKNKIDSKGREIIKTIKRKNYTINFVKQDNLEENLGGLYKLAAELLADESLRN